MDVAPSKKYRLKQEGPGNFEEENAWLKEWIHEELAHGEVWQKQYESLLEHQAQLCSLLQTKSLKPLEKKTQTLQEELEEIQEALRECQNRSRQRQLHIHKQEKENERMAETVKELEKKVFKQQLEEKSNKNILKELRTEGNELKRHLSECEAKWHTKNDRIRQKQNQIEKLSTTIQGLSLRSQELHRNINILEDSVAEAQQEMMLSQKEAQSGTSAGGFLWEERACDQMKRLPCLDPASFKKEFPSLWKNEVRRRQMVEDNEKQRNGAPECPDVLVFLSAHVWRPVVASAHERRLELRWQLLLEGFSYTQLSGMPGIYCGY